MKTKLIKEILGILFDIHPECDVEGHRVHTTSAKVEKSGAKAKTLGLPSYVNFVD